MYKTLIATETSMVLLLIQNQIKPLLANYLFWHINSISSLIVLWLT